MDELELLKKDWKKQDADFPKLTYQEIYKIIHKRSSSIVKWILIICIAEFIFWGAVNFFVPDSYWEIYEKFNLKTFLYTFLGIHYLITIGFIYLFYNSYRAISVIESTKLLMKRILKARKLVNYYVYYNIIMYIILSLIVNSIMFSQPTILLEAVNLGKVQIDSDRLLLILLIAQIVSLVIVCGLLWLYYRIIYGILLKKLNKNYKELETLEF